MESCDGVNGGAVTTKTSLVHDGYSSPTRPGRFLSRLGRRDRRSVQERSVHSRLAADERGRGQAQRVRWVQQRRCTSFARSPTTSGLIKSVNPNRLVSLGAIGGGQCGAEEPSTDNVHDLETIDLRGNHYYYSPSVPMPGDQWTASRSGSTNVTRRQADFRRRESILKETFSSLPERADAFRSSWTLSLMLASWAHSCVRGTGTDLRDLSKSAPPSDLGTLELSLEWASAPYTVLVGYANGATRTMRADGPNFQNQQLLGPGQGSPSVRQDGSIAVRDVLAYGIATHDARFSIPTTHESDLHTPDHSPRFSPDGTKIVYGSFATGGIHLINADGSGSSELNKMARKTSVLIISLRDANRLPPQLRKQWAARTWPETLLFGGGDGCTIVSCMVTRLCS